MLNARAVFLYNRPSQKSFPCCKFDNRVSYSVLPAIFSISPKIFLKKLAKKFGQKLGSAYFCTRKRDGSRPGAEKEFNDRFPYNFQQ